MDGATKTLIKDLPGSSGRVNVIGMVVHLGKRSIVIDDTTGQTKVRFFDEHACAVGQPVLVIGEYRDGAVIGAVVRPLLSPKWLVVRRMELGQPRTETEEQGSGKEQGKPGEEPATYEQVLSAVRELDTGSGAALDELYARLGKQAEVLVMNLLAEGEVFENRPGRIKVLD